MNFLRPLHLFPLHLLPPSPPVICFPFPAMCQVHASKSHQGLYYCHIRWPLSFYPTGHLQDTQHSVKSPLPCLSWHHLNNLFLGFLRVLFPGFLPQQYLCILLNSEGLSLRSFLHIVSALECSRSPHHNYIPYQILLLCCSILRSVCGSFPH